MSYTLELDFDVPAHRVADAVAAVKAVAKMGLPPWESPQDLLLRAFNMSKEDAIAVLNQSRIPPHKRELMLRLLDGESVASLAKEFNISAQSIYQTQWSLRENFVRLGDNIPDGWSRTIVVVPDSMKHEVDAIQHTALRQFAEKKE